MRNRLLICVAAMLLAGGSVAFAQGVSQGTTDQKSTAPKAGDAKQAQTPAQDKSKASSASQPRDEKGRFTKKSDQSGSSAAAPSAKSTATTSGNQAASQPRDQKGRFMKKSDQPGANAAAPNAKSSATTGLGSSQGGADAKKNGVGMKRKTTPSWVSKATKAGQAATGRPAP